jgi:hypothetical protein
LACRGPSLNGAAELRPGFGSAGGSSVKNIGSLLKLIARPNDT